ncbi:MAG: tetratricopeptide repeat protein [Coriobacteriales bacterium]|nr:tetratricopeptide repeat protein [Coriobacteriales bacterium]
MSKRNTTKNKSNHAKRMARSASTEVKPEVSAKREAKQRQEATKSALKKTFTILVCALLVLLFALPSLSGLMSCSNRSQKDEDFAAKIEELHSELDANPDKTELQIEIADEFLAWGQAIFMGRIQKSNYESSTMFNEAVEHYEAYGDLSALPEAQFNYAVANAFAGNYEAAIPALKDAVAVDDSNADAWAALGYALSGIGDNDAAVEAYQKAVDLDPDSDAGQLAAYQLESLQ